MVLKFKFHPVSILQETLLITGTEDDFAHLQGEPFIHARASKTLGWYFAPRTMQVARSPEEMPRYLGYVEVYYDGKIRQLARQCSAGVFSTQDHALVAAIMLGNDLLDALRKWVDT